MAIRNVVMLSACRTLQRHGGDTEAENGGSRFLPMGAGYARKWRTQEQHQEQELIAGEMLYIALDWHEGFRGCGILSYVPHTKRVGVEIQRRVT